LAKNIVDARNELLKLGRVTPQIPGQEDTLKLLEQKDFPSETTLILILAQLDITLSSLRDALRGSGTKDFTTLETDAEAILSRLNTNLSTRASQATLSTRASEDTSAAILARLQGNTGSHGAVSVEDTATQIRPANASRKEFLIYNNGATILYIGSSNTVTTVNAGVILVPQRGASGRIYKGALWGIVSAGSTDTRYWEVT